MSKSDLGEYGPTPPGTPDAKGTPFDPDRHQKYAGGRAMKNRKTGEWVQKGGRGKVKDSPASAEHAPKVSPAKVIDPIAAHESKNPAEGISEPETIQPAQVRGTASTIPDDAKGPQTEAAAPGIPGGPLDPNAAQLDATCRTAVVMAEGLLIMALGPDMKHDDAERTAILESWKLFLADKDGVRLPPWAALLAGYVTIAAARADRASFQQRCALWGARFKKWFSR